MHNPTKMDYSKLFGFDMVANDVIDGVDFQNATIGAKLGAKVGKEPPPKRHGDPVISPDQNQIRF